MNRDIRDEFFALHKFLQSRKSFRL